MGTKSISLHQVGSCMCGTLTMSYCQQFISASYHHHVLCNQNAHMLIKPPFPHRYSVCCCTKSSIVGYCQPPIIDCGVYIHVVYGTRKQAVGCIIRFCSQRQCSQHKHQQWPQTIGNTQQEWQELNSSAGDYKQGYNVRTFFLLLSLYTNCPKGSSCKFLLDRLLL